MPAAVRAVADRVDVAPLDVHAGGEHGVRPSEIGLGRGRHVFVDEADLPVRGQGGGDRQETLRRHERLGLVGQVVGVLERAERRFVAREDADDFASGSVGAIASWRAGVLAHARSRKDDDQPKHSPRPHARPASPMSPSVGPSRSGRSGARQESARSGAGGADQRDR